jgi:hypothetical protein
MGKYLVKTFRKNQKYVPKVFSGFEKWTFICPFLNEPTILAHFFLKKWGETIML